jgi:ATP-dependent helicase HrpB
VPPALVGDGAVILLEPRRIAARAVAQRIAEERGWTVGREIGWQIRFDTRVGPSTGLLVMTEGVLTARMQQDPLLSGFTTVVIDEFHERSIHADLAIALARQAWKARSDLRLVVMSATIDAAAVSRFLGECPVVDVPGRTYPVQISYAPQQSIAAAAVDHLANGSGDVLCFLPGVFEIQQVISDLHTRITGNATEVLPLYGAMDAGAQDDVLRGARGRRRIIVGTNVAETSLTVPGVTAVVDSGLRKVARYDADRAIDSLDVERIAQDSADQRAGRAGRLAPGRVTRVWDVRDRLRARSEADIHRIDLSSVVLDVLAWGGDPESLEWFDPPSADGLRAALQLLERLGAVRDRRLTELGSALTRLPVHPRLGCMLHAGRGATTIVRACALLSERHLMTRRSAPTTPSDLLSAVDAWNETPPHVQRVARELERLVSRSHRAGPDELSEDGFLRAVLSGYPDRVAQRREPGSSRFRLSSGTGAVLGSESGVRDADFLVAIDLRAHGDDARIRMASRVDRDWLMANGIETVHAFDPTTGVVRAMEVERYDALVLRERPVTADPEEAGRLLAEAWLARRMAADDEQLLRRARFAGHQVDLASAVRIAAAGVRALADVELTRGLPSDVLRTLDARAPRTLTLPSGRMVRLEYLEDGRVQAAVKLQDAFGLLETPRIGPARRPVLFALLAPNGRPVQLTTDLRSFWARTYPEVRKELRGRYPKHRWPENPLLPRPG